MGFLGIKRKWCFDLGYLSRIITKSEVECNKYSGSVMELSRPWLQWDVLTVPAPSDLSFLLLSPVTFSWNWYWPSFRRWKELPVKFKNIRILHDVMCYNSTTVLTNCKVSWFSNPECLPIYDWRVWSPLSDFNSLLPRLLLQTECEMISRHSTVLDGSSWSSPQRDWAGSEPDIWAGRLRTCQVIGIGTSSTHYRSLLPSFCPVKWSVLFIASEAAALSYIADDFALISSLLLCCLLLSLIMLHRLLPFIFYYTITPW